MCFSVPRAENPTDVKWLKTALHKGTSKDRANAGALLVQTNPPANLETLETLVGFTKVTNKNSTDTVGKYQLNYQSNSGYTLIAKLIEIFIVYLYRCIDRIVYECFIAG